MHIPKEKRKKIYEKSLRCIILRNDSESKAYKLMNPTNRRTYTSRDVIFYDIGDHPTSPFDSPPNHDSDPIIAPGDDE